MKKTDANFEETKTKIFDNRKKAVLDNIEDYKDQENLRYSAVVEATAAEGKVKVSFGDEQAEKEYLQNVKEGEKFAEPTVLFNIMDKEYFLTTNSPYIHQFITNFLRDGQIEEAALWFEIYFIDPLTAKAESYIPASVKRPNSPEGSLARAEEDSAWDFHRKQYQDMPSVDSKVCECIEEWPVIINAMQLIMQSKVNLLDRKVYKEQKRMIKDFDKFGKKVIKRKEDFKYSSVVSNTFAGIL